MSTYSNRLQPALQNLLQRVVRFFHPRSSCTTHYVCGHLRQTKITRKASDVAEDLLLYRVVRFFHRRSSCTMHILVLVDVQRITLNPLSCIMISSGRTKQLDKIAGFLPRHWLYEWFSQFHSCGTYSVLSRSHSTMLSFNTGWTVMNKCNCRQN